MEFVVFFKFGKQMTVATGDFSKYGLYSRDVTKQGKLSWCREVRIFLARLCNAFHKSFLDSSKLAGVFQAMLGRSQRALFEFASLALWSQLPSSKEASLATGPGYGSPAPPQTTPRRMQLFTGSF